jgi:nucleolar GTP-binding protein
VPTNKDFVDIVLTRTQRKTPTEVHAGWQISRIRSFYMRKVRFTQATFHEKLGQIVEEFPKLDDVHPFYADLINVLYDKDHYKLALGQINTARQIVDNVAKDYLRLLKFGDSLFRCKQLKRAALGRMCTVMRKQGPTLAYLEEVRKHMARLPSIDPSTRTLLVCGYPNVGKSSFMNKVTRAEVEVQPYAFTTKSLFVGHMDHKYQRWQVIDTPGILDHPLEERNTIEMQSITALAHLQCAVLFFLDISGQCGYTIQQQCSLFDNISPLFSSKPLMIVATKIDVQPLATLDKDDRALIDGIVKKSGASFKTMSNISEEGIAEVKSAACEALLVKRVEMKMRGDKVESVVNRLSVTEPRQRDGKAREVSIPPSVLARQQAAAAAIASGSGSRMVDDNDNDDDDDDEPNGRYYDKTEGRFKYGSMLSRHDDAGPAMVRKWLERDREKAAGGPGVYKPDTTRYYLLRDDEWKTDIMPEIMDGKNVADFIDPDIMERLMALEAEEEGFAAADQAAADAAAAESDEDEETKALYSEIRHRKMEKIQMHRLSKDHNRSIVKTNKTPAEVSKSLQKSGWNEEDADKAAIAASNESMRGRKRIRESDVIGRAVSSSMKGGDDAGEEDGETIGDGHLASEVPAKRVRSSSAVRARRIALLNKYDGDEKKAERAMREKSFEPIRLPAQKLGLKNEEVMAKAKKDFGKFRSKKFEGKGGESDNRIQIKKEKWMLAGKRGNGKTERR